MKQHPAEATTASGAVALLVGLVLGVPAETAAALGVALGLVPSVVTFVVNRGGVSGLARKLWRGRG